MKSVLLAVVDDQSQQAACLALRSRGYEPEIVRDLEAALERVHSGNEYHCVLIQDVLPNVYGAAVDENAPAAITVLEAAKKRGLLSIVCITRDKPWPLTVDIAFAAYRTSDVRTRYGYTWQNAVRQI
jgi:hypothetical protein